MNLTKEINESISKRSLLEEYAEDLWGIVRDMHHSHMECCTNVYICDKADGIHHRAKKLREEILTYAKL